MIDLFNLPKSAKVDQFFGAMNSANSNSTHTWNKPRGAKMVFMLCIGGGGNGGNGQTGSAGTNRGGGGGGAMGGVCSGMFPAILLPDTLRVNVGGPGEETSVNAHYLSFTSTYYLFAGGGGAGSNGSGGSGGSGGANGGSGATVIARCGFYNLLSGWDGVTGGSSAQNGSSVTGFANNMVHEGAGGAGTDTSNTTRSGGSFTGNSIIPDIPGGSTAGERGRDGVTIWKPFCASPGTGGASNGTGTGGNGGNGGIGCGGGGGGAGTTGGTGGKGGPGYCLIVTFF